MLIFNGPPARDSILNVAAFFKLDGTPSFDSYTGTVHSRHAAKHAASVDLLKGVASPFDTEAKLLKPFEAGGSFRTSTRPTVCSDSDEPSPRVCMIIHPEGQSVGTSDLVSSDCSL